MTAGLLGQLEDAGFGVQGLGQCFESYLQGAVRCCSWELGLQP